MDGYLEFYSKHKSLFIDVYDFFNIWACLLIGIIAMNTFNKENEKDLNGKKLFVAMLFLSMVIYNGTIKWMNKNAVYTISLFLGYGASDILSKWRRKKIWDRFDFIDKGGGKND